MVFEPRQASSGHDRRLIGRRVAERHEAHPVGAQRAGPPRHLAHQRCLADTTQPDQVPDTRAGVQSVDQLFDQRLPTQQRATGPSLGNARCRRLTEQTHGLTGDGAQACRRPKSELLDKRLAGSLERAQNRVGPTGVEIELHQLGASPFIGRVQPQNVLQQAPPRGVSAFRSCRTAAS